MIDIINKALEGVDSEICTEGVDLPQWQNFKEIEEIRDEMCTPLLPLISDIEEYEEVENLVLQKFIAKYGHKAKWTDMVLEAYNFSVFTLLMVYHT